MRNVERNLPEELHKFKRKRKQQEMLPPLPDELYERVEQLKMMEPSKANFRVISEAMVATFPLHHQMLVEHSTPGEIMDTFPRLVSYQEQMLHQAFRRIFPDADDEEDLRDVFTTALLLQNKKFGAVEDARRPS